MNSLTLHRFLKVLFRGVLFVVVTIVLMELGLRLLALFPHDTRLYINDGELGHRARSNTLIGGYTTNSRGFNDVEHAVQKKPGTRRIAVMGDSFTWGPGVSSNENVVRLLQTLANREDVRCDALNMGIPAAGPRTYLGLLKTEVVATESDIACVLFYVGNDITDSHPDFRNRVWLGQPRNVLRRQYLVGRSREFYYTFRFLRFGVRWGRERLASPRRKLGYASYSRKNLLSIHRMNMGVHEKSPNRFVQRSYESAREILFEMKRDAEESGVELIVILAPQALQVSTMLWDELVRAYHLSASDFDASRPQTVLSRIMDGGGITYLDLLPSFRTAARHKPLYFIHDTHWNRAGHALAAKCIWEFLTSRGLGDRPSARSAPTLEVRGP